MADGGMFGDALRQPPANVDAEQYLLGSILVNNKAYHAVDEIVEPEHFYNGLYGRIFAICRNVINAGSEANGATVMPHLLGDPLLGRQAAPQVMASLLVLNMGVASAASYARSIRDAWVRRCLYKACSEVLDRCCRPGDEKAPDIVDALENSLLELARGNG